MMISEIYYAYVVKHIWCTSSYLILWSRRKNALYIQSNEAVFVFDADLR